VLLLRLRGLEVTLYSRGDGGRGRKLGEEAGATFASADTTKLDDAFAAAVGGIDIAIEASGFSPLAFEAMDVVGPNGIVCLTGVSAGSRSLTIDAAHLNLEMVLNNRVVFGTVNANRRHFESGVQHLQAIASRWPSVLERMITRRLPLAQFDQSALEHPDDLKVVVDVNPGA
jgi:glucose 1-dehydrogenase